MLENIFRKILLVEDNRGCMTAIKSLLELKEYIVCTATNGLDAVMTAENEKFDLILMDYEMPLMNGIEAAKKIRETDKNIPIISISSRQDEEYINECLACGINHHIPKLIIIEAININLFDIFFVHKDQDGRNKK